MISSMLLCFFAVSAVIAYQSAPWQSASGQANDFLVIPGDRAGQLRLGTPEQMIPRLTPAPNQSKISIPNCGTEYFVTLVSDARHPGALNVFARDEKVFEIEAVRGRYHTEKGTATNTPSGDVRAKYQALDAYLYLGQTPEALNESPLVVWADNKRGIAFTLTRDGKAGSAYSVYSSIIFPPDSIPCVEGYPLDSQSWERLPPYSLGEPHLAEFSLTSMFN